ncbi:uncharacterized protein [Ptychodera flava]|uniref:uncharacterized protein n=1 Tax=Ptychodera flava TaxID=63121 RepID=UPI003969D547
MTFIFDPSHEFKKIRNNILKSSRRQGPRHLVHGDHDIIWHHWVRAYEWDLNTNPVRIHFKLTEEHLHPDQTAKMRNHLAEEVLNKDMLYLMLAYQKSLPTEIDRWHLNKTIELLEQTSQLIDNFRDLRPIKEYDDTRLHENMNILRWFSDWEATVMDDDSMSPEEKKRSLLSKETRDDLISLILGFDRLCKNKLGQCRGGYIIPGRVNSDIDLQSSLKLTFRFANAALTQHQRRVNAAF